MTQEIDTNEFKPEDYRREDLKKAGRILMYAFISAAVVTTILYYLPI